MRIVRALAGSAVAAIAACSMMTSADAAPPTVVPSPGYDARLQEQRAAQHAGSPDVTVAPVPHRHHLRAHRHHKPDRGAE
ncbi:hypothetical protein ACQR1W_12535 [Bradyrhizobium sp. HKCCYLS1011]|uniref:hypothetical protein n=1 Tax=Bradyrhizobium sp. HKCCYLS1011 TaxID=3420733 RepID=UPI003EBDCB90